MFWGLVMDPDKWYTQTVQTPFHVSMATLDLATANDEIVQVILCYNNTNYQLCSLKKDSVWQVPLDLNFQKGTKIAFACNGQSHVHLTGYLKLDEDFDFDEQEEVDNDNNKDSEEEDDEDDDDDDDDDSVEEEIQKRSSKQVKKNKLMQQQWHKQKKNQDKQKLVIGKSKKNNKERSKAKKL